MLSPRALTYHYLHLARRQVAAKLSRERIALKRYFYALRPALTLRFLRLQGGQRPPMHLPALVDGTDLPAATVRVIGRLVAAKSRTREMSTGPRIPALDRLIAAEMPLRPDRRATAGPSARRPGGRGPAVSPPYSPMAPTNRSPSAT
jgi:uncharacterized protein